MLINCMYYVTLTAFIVIASCISFQGFNTTSAINLISLLIGFLMIFSIVFLLNISRKENEYRSKTTLGVYEGNNLPPSDNGVAGFTSVRKSLQMSRNSYGEEETVGF